jgi:small subunit ribosomal protein S4
MSRIGPRLKIIRRLGTPLPGLTSKDGERRPTPPGQHGASTARRKKISLYRKRLEEKQKVRFHYGVTETQMRRAFDAARKIEGKTGDNFLALLEARLDSVVFRLGFARTIPAARQLVGHGHILVNGNRVDRASFRVNIGDEIALGTKIRENVSVQAQVERGPVVKIPGWLALDPNDSMKGRMLSGPTRETVPFIVNEAAIVEFYAQ